MFSCYTEQNVMGAFFRRERECAQTVAYSAPSSDIYVNISDFLNRPPQKLKRTCSVFNLINMLQGASEGIGADSTVHPLVIYM